MKKVQIIILFMVIFMLVKLYNYQALGQKFTSSSLKKQIEIGYTIQSALNLAKDRVTANHIGGRNAMYRSNKTVHLKLNKPSLVKRCFHNSEFKETDMGINCISVTFAGKEKNINCELIEGFAIETGEYVECSGGLTGHVNEAYMLSVWEDVDD